LALDLDLFKNINDQYGHQTGDEVLKFMVTSSLSILRPSDILGRIGGEEFAIFLPETSLQDAHVVAERLRQCFGMGLVVNEHFIATSVSIGVAESGLDGDEPAILFGTADKRLYCAKQAGRNRVVSESADPLDVVLSSLLIREGGLASTYAANNRNIG
jgi:diguanylate cyclase (GGDEF)-like protein